MIIYGYYSLHTYRYISISHIHRQEMKVFYPKDPHFLSLESLMACTAPAPRPNGANKIITGSYQGMLRMCPQISHYHTLPLSSFYHFKTFIDFNHLVWRYYPKQKEYKIEDLILESNMEVVSQHNQPTVTFVKLWPQGLRWLARLPSCKLKLADLCREVMEPQVKRRRDFGPIWGVQIFPPERWGDFTLDLEFGGDKKI